MNRIKLIFILLAIAFLAISAVKTFYKSDPKNLHYHPYRFTDKDEVILTVTKFIKSVENDNARNAYRLLSKSEGSYKDAYLITKSYCKNLKFRQGYMLSSLKLIEAKLKDMKAELVYIISNSSHYDTTKFTLLKENGQWRISPLSDYFNKLVGRNFNVEKTLSVERQRK